MLTTRSLISGMALEDPYPHMDKLRSVCNSCMGRPYMNMDVIGLRVLFLYLTVMLRCGFQSSHITTFTHGINCTMYSWTSFSIVKEVEPLR